MRWTYYLWNKKQRKFRHIGEGQDAWNRWRKFKGKKKRELLSGSPIAPIVEIREIHNIGAPYAGPATTRKRRKRKR